MADMEELRKLNGQAESERALPAIARVVSCRVPAWRSWRLATSQQHVTPLDHTRATTPSLAVLLGKSMNFADTSKLIYQHRLSMALKCIHCPFLEKRLAGVKELVDLVMKTSNNEQDREVVQSVYQETPR